MSIEVDVDYDSEELEEGYWDNMCLAEFWSKYEITYAKDPNSSKQSKKTRIQILAAKKVFNRKIREIAILRKYLNYSNEEDLA